MQKARAGYQLRSQAPQEASLYMRGSWCASRRPSPGGDHGAPNLVPRYFIEGHGLSTLASRSTTVRAVLAHRHRPHRMARIGRGMTAPAAQSPRVPAIAGTADCCAIDPPTTRFGALGESADHRDPLPAAEGIGGRGAGKGAARGSDLPERRWANVRVADNTLGAHGVASSPNSARPAHFGVLKCRSAADRAARHRNTIRSSRFRRSSGPLAFRPESAAVAD